MTHRTDNSIIPSPRDMAGFKIAFSTKRDGNMLRYNATRLEVRQNRTSFLRANTGPGQFLALIRPSHSANIDVITKHSSELTERRTILRAPTIEADFDFYHEGSDGIITKEQSIVVGLISGDCVPLILWEPGSLTHGIVHIGLLGALNGIVTLIGLALAGLGTKIEDIHFYLGPSISALNYDLSQSGVWIAIKPQVDANALIRSMIAPHLTDNHFDLRGVIVDQLAVAGADLKKVEVYEPSTASPDSLFYSHYAASRKGEPSQGFLSLIGADRTS